MRGEMGFNMGDNGSVDGCYNPGRTEMDIGHNV